MPSHLLDSRYFKDMFSSSPMREIFSDENRIVKWLDVEVALARAQAVCKIIPEEAAINIEKAAVLENIDFPTMKAHFDRVGFPILPFVKQLTSSCDEETAKWVHFGATTQDVLDTGMVLQIREGISLIEFELRAITIALRDLANEYRDAVMAGRTFQQHAAPITFGYKAAIWLDEILRHIDRFEALKPRLYIGQCSGAVGTFATLGTSGKAVQDRMMEILDLNVPNISWHVSRDTWAEMVHTIAMLGSTLAKIANEVTILMRTEISELSEPFEKGRGASTTLPQKRNPISCEPIIANGHKLRELVGSQLNSMIQEHERGALGQMHLEWMIIPESFLLISGSLKHSRFILENLQVDTQKMRLNLELNGGLIMSEALMMGLAPRIGKKEAHDIVYEIASQAYESNTPLSTALRSDERISKLLNEDQIEELLNPLNYTGIVSQMIDKVIDQASGKL